MAKKQPTPSTSEAPKPRRVPQVSILERRLQNPFGDGSPTIKLKEPGWALHIFDTSRAGRFHIAQREKGWVPVLPEDLDGPAEDYGFDIAEGRVVRGERGKEILMKMPQRMYDQIAQRKAELTAHSNTPRQLKRAAIEQTAAQYSDQAADYLHRNVTITETQEPVPLDEPPS